SAKKINSFVLYVSRDAMNIDGLSEKTIEKFIERGYVHEPADFYKLEEHRAEIESMEGFGRRAFEKLINAINASKNPEIANFIYSLGILNVGLSTARLIAKHFEFDFDRIRKASASELTEIDGIGDVIAKSFEDYFANEKNSAMVDRLLEYIEFKIPEITMGDSENKIMGLTFVITGSVNHFSNRSELKKYIEDRDGKVAGSVSKNTSYLINNDNTSTSSKNKKAKELGVPIITEDEFINEFGAPSRKL
nr:NAD-dependent DNA ligase LigA [Lachnospiraceae bacterium]